MNLKKQNQKELDDLTERFVIVMKQIIAHHPVIVKNRVDFAKKIGTIPPTINRWENKAGHPTLENCISLCKKFPDFITPSELLFGNKSGTKNGTLSRSGKPISARKARK